MAFSACHGVLPHEHENPQRFVVDAELLIDLHEAGARDDLDATANYAALYEIVRAVVEGVPKRLVESVAEELAAFPRVRAVRVTVHKPGAPIGGVFADVGVDILRRRGR